MDDDPPTLVTWSLEQIVPGRTLVTLRHPGATEGGKAMDRHDKIWTGILADLKDHIETGDVSRKTKISQALMTKFMFAMPAKTKSEDVEVP